MIVRFSEFEYYNINQDEEWVRFLATMDKGSYWAEVPRGTAGEYRKNKDIFKARVVDCIASCINPCEVDLDPTVH
jgi:hypothetical protein